MDYWGVWFWALGNLPVSYVTGNLPLINYATCRPILLECPDIIVGTPSRILGYIRAGNIDLKATVEMVVIDEADLLFSFAYDISLPVIYHIIYFLVIAKYIWIISLN